MEKGTAFDDYASHNYYIHPNLQIVWANRTSLFDHFGRLVREDENDTRTDEEILEEFPPYEYEYQSTFFGVPFYDTYFAQKLKIVKYRNGSIELREANVTFNLKT